MSAECPNAEYSRSGSPDLGAERLVRAARGLQDGPLAVVAEQSNMQVVTSLNAEGQAAGLRMWVSRCAMPMRCAPRLSPAPATPRPRQPF